MARITLLLGVLLILLGVGFYFGTGRESVTALIPAFLGLPMALLGAWANRAASPKVPMHIAVLLAVLGVAGTARGVAGAVRMLGGAEVERPEATVAQAIVAVLCLVYVVMAVGSFVKARQANG